MDNALKLLITTLIQAGYRLVESKSGNGFNVWGTEMIGLDESTDISKYQRLADDAGIAISKMPTSAEYPDTPFHLWCGVSKVNNTDRLMTAARTIDGVVQ